jgi:hypothetical protein
VLAVLALLARLTPVMEAKAELQVADVRLVVAADLAFSFFATQTFIQLAQQQVHHLSLTLAGLLFTGLQVLVLLFGIHNNGALRTT